MYIEISQDPEGRSVVKIAHKEASTENDIGMEFHTEQVVIVEVDRTGRAMLARTRSNGTKTQVDSRGDAWLTGADNRIENTADRS